LKAYSSPQSSAKLIPNQGRHIVVQTQPVVQTEQGAVAGVGDHGAIRFRGIPYASPPFGKNRFQPPVAASAWDGIRDTAEFGVGVPQASFDGDPFDPYFNPRVQGMDCLTVDIWTPDVSTSGLPVMVWIHGGGFMTGTGSAPAHDGYTFARDGIVHVGINYRLGIDGFTYFDDGVENLGLQDQIAALEWVQRNIARFGGDPTQVTVFGQSGGAVAVMDLLAMPAARGLFARGIAMSGSPIASASPESALRVTNRLAERLGVEPTRAAFATVSLKRTVAETIPMAMEFLDFSRSGLEAFTVSPYRAVHGTASMPLSPLAAASESTVPLLTGTVRNEATGFLTALNMVPDLPESLGRQMLKILGADGSVERSYRDGPRHLTSPVELVEAAWTDVTFRIPTLDLVAARPAESHVYEFRWESPSFPPRLGSNHALEVPFMRDDLNAMRDVGPAGDALLGPNAPDELAHRMHAAFAAYASTGDPGWPAYTTSERSTHVFDEVDSLTNDAAAPERAAWEETK
jgi:para-nitrobenzyl esterase